MRKLSILWLATVALPASAAVVTVPIVKNAGGNPIQATAVITVNEAGEYIVGGGGGGGAGTEYTEDAASSANPVGSMTMCVRRDTTSTSEVSADDDNMAVKCDSRGRIRISVEDTLPVSIAGTVAISNAGLTTLAGAVTSAKVQVDCITGCSGGTSYTEDAAAAADPVGLAVISRRRDTLSTSEVSANGDNVALLSDSRGQLYIHATDTDALLTTQAGYVDGLEALIGTTNTNTGAISGKLPASLGAQAVGSSLSVTPATSSTWAATQSGTWNVTNISGTVSLPTGASTEATLAAASAKLPASLGIKTAAASLSIAPASDASFVATIADGADITQGDVSDAAWSGTGDATINSVLKGLYGVAASTAPSSVKIDQTTPGTTNLVAAGQNGTWNITNVSGTVSLPTGAATAAKQPALGTAGTASSDVITVQGIASGTPLPSVGYAGTATTTVTRPADTTAYAANDAMSDSTSAPTSGGFTLSSMCRISGGSGILTDLALIYSTASAVAGDIWIYDASVTAQNDNAAWSVTDADQAKLVAKVPFVTVADTLNAVHNIQNLNIGYTCSGTANLRFMVKVTTGYTPASADALTVRAKFVQTN